MKEFILNIFDSSKWADGPNITLFGFWHFLYIFIIIAATIVVAVLTYKCKRETKTKILNIYAGLIVFVYISDLFIMPLYGVSYSGYIDKLPFHICTLMCPLIILSRNIKVLHPLKKVVAVLSIVSTLMYITYPGTAVGEVSPFVYRIVQTFVYHGLVFGYGVLSVTTGDVTLGFKKIYEEALALIFIMCWALFGNKLYAGIDVLGGGSYDWFFVTGRTFPFVPSNIMPLVVVVCIFAMCVIIQGIFKIVYKQLEKKKLMHYMYN